jgi:hypothetical protein
MKMMELVTEVQSEISAENKEVALDILRELTGELNAAKSVLNAAKSVVTRLQAEYDELLTQDIDNVVNVINH